MAARHSFQLVGFDQTLQQHVGINDSSLADQESLHFESRRIRKGSSGENPWRCESSQHRVHVRSDLPRRRRPKIMPFMPLRTVMRIR